VSRCKLITPVLLQLERPMLSPVKEIEFVIQGAKEHMRWKLEIFSAGIFLGMLISILIVALIGALTR
jgi:hypothetical protein